MLDLICFLEAHHLGDNTAPFPPLARVRGAVKAHRWGPPKPPGRGAGTGRAWFWGRRKDSKPLQPVPSGPQPAGCSGGSGGSEPGTLCLCGPAPLGLDLAFLGEPFVTLQLLGPRRLPDPAPASWPSAPSLSPPHLLGVSKPKRNLEAHGLQSRSSWLRSRGASGRPGRCLGHGAQLCTRADLLTPLGPLAPRPPTTPPRSKGAQSTSVSALHAASCATHSHAACGCLQGGQVGGGVPLYQMPMCLLIRGWIRYHTLCFYLFVFNY